MNNKNMKSKSKSKLISQGSFGCIYYPAINCKGKTNDDDNKKFATKIQKTSFNSLNEINIGKMIMKIPNYHFYFVPVIKSCPIKLKAIHDNEQMLSKCNIIHEKNGDGDAKDGDAKDGDGDANGYGSDGYVLLTMPFISNIPFGKGTGTGKGTGKGTDVIVYIIDTYRTLVNALGLLVDNNIVHLDLKNENILYNIKLNITQLIDFGLSIPIDNLTSDNLIDYFYIYSPDYYIWPVEVHVINFLIHRVNTADYVLTSEHIITITNDVISNNIILTKLDNTSFNDMYKESCLTYLNTYIGVGKEKIINELIKTCKTWDNYSLSILFLELLSYLFPYGKNSFIDHFYQLLIHNILPERYSIKDTMKRFTDFFNLEENIQAYKDLID